MNLVHTTYKTLHGTARGLRQRLAYALTCLATGLALLPQIAAAELPEIEEPTNGGGGGLFESIQGYAADAGILIGLILATVAFLVVAGAALGKFREASARGGQWGEFATVVVVGIILVIVVIFMANQAAEILVA